MSARLSHPAIAALAACLFAVSCGQPEGEALVVDIGENDPEMKAAIAEAKGTIGVFIAHLEQHPDDETALIKAPIDTGESVEHMWIDGVAVDGDEFTGNLANMPRDQSQYELGDVVRVPHSDISDWVYFDHEGPHGGYTIEVMEKRMAPQ